MAGTSQQKTGSGLDIEDKIHGVIYGNCIGDAIGLLSEFMTKKDAKQHYKQYKRLEYDHKLADMHRSRWQVGDWTDDSDQMILIMESLTEHNAVADAVDFASRLSKWRKQGFAELGDYVGMGIGSTTAGVMDHKSFLTKPHEAAKAIWEDGGRKVAPNGGVMRTSILGIPSFTNLTTVVSNARTICKTTHADPRCQASCVAVTTAIALMLQSQPRHFKNGKYQVKNIISDSFEQAKTCFSAKEKDYISELKRHMFADSLSDLHLDDQSNIGYTFKCLGAGFWALKQDDFRKALEKIVMAAGDADTNGAVAGALLGCKVGAKNLPPTWLSGLKHKDWLDTKIAKFLRVALGIFTPSEDDTTTENGHVEQEDSVTKL